MTEQVARDSVAHVHDMQYQWRDKYPDGKTGWSPERAPKWPSENEADAIGRLRTCEYCGSMHPADVAAAIKAGAVAHFVDRKYGWPHKAYVDSIPNPHAGMIESRIGNSHPPQAEIDAGKWIKVRCGYDSHTGEPRYTYRDAGAPAGLKTHGKFYSIHLQDATCEDRATIERHLGVAFTFTDDGRVRCAPWVEPISEQG